MNKSQREMQKLIDRYPSIELVNDRGGFYLMAPGGARRRLGALKAEGSSHGLRHIEQWCARHSGQISPQGGGGRGHGNDGA